jgi:N-methylhydantoinase A/oxoprolinase/acetone carboxylase beta subunit
MKEKVNSDPRGAKLGTRNALHEAEKREIALYRWELLRPGNVVPGGSILESANSTYLVPPEWNLEIDHYGNALIKRGTS